MFLTVPGGVTSHINYNLGSHHARLFILPTGLLWFAYETATPLWGTIKMVHTALRHGHLSTLMWFCNSS